MYADVKCSLSLYIVLIFIRSVFPLMDVLNCFEVIDLNIIKISSLSWGVAMLFVKHFTKDLHEFLMNLDHRPFLFLGYLKGDKRWTCPITGVPTRFVMGMGWHHILTCLKKHGVYQSLIYIYIYNILSHVPYRMLVVEIDEICLVCSRWLIKTCFEWLTCSMFRRHLWTMQLQKFSEIFPLTNSLRVRDGGRMPPLPIIHTFSTFQLRMLPRTWWFSLV